MHSLGIYLIILKKISNGILINKSVNFTVRQKNEKTLILQFYLVVYMGLHFHKDKLAFHHSLMFSLCSYPRGGAQAHVPKQGLVIELHPSRLPKVKVALN